MFYCETNVQLPLNRVSGKCEVQAVIYFLMAENLSTSATHKWLQNMYDVNEMPECTIHSQVHGFWEKWENIHNAGRSGWLSDASTDEMRHTVLEILEHDRRLMICEIWDLLVDEHSIEFSRMTVQHVLTDDSNTKVCVRWVP